MRLFLMTVLMTSLAACSSWDDGPFGYRTPHADPGVTGDRSRDGQSADDNAHQGALRLQNDEAQRRQTPLTSR
jgi:hypothetical protein